MEIVRWAFEEGLARRTVNIPGAEERFASDYRFHTPPGFLGRTVYRLDELTPLWADLDTTFTDHSLVPMHYEEIGTYVLVTLQQTARLRGSDDEINFTFYQLWLVSEGKIQETRTFTDNAEALEAAGLPE